MTKHPTLFSAQNCWVQHISFFFCQRALFWLNSSFKLFACSFVSVVMTCAGVKVVYQCLNVEYMYMWYREIECACRKVVHTAHRFNHEAVGWIVHIELGVCVCVCTCSWIVGLSAVPAVSLWTFRHLWYVRNAWQEWLWTTWVWATSWLHFRKEKRKGENLTEMGSEVSHRVGTGEQAWRKE